MHRPNGSSSGEQQQQPEILPPGVGRIPQWWMEITPHYVLDLEEEEFRRRTEEQMACYFAQMAAADDAGMLDSNGNPLLGPDGKPMAWGNRSGWAGRSNAPGSPGGGGSPLGRNFVPGQITPETLQLLGIDANSDPDYRSYLTGAKYPPGYWEKLAELGYATGPGFSANNLAQTDYGRYGRQAEQPKHKPSWAKMKLRSTTHGQDIRHGIYDSSPKRDGSQRRVQQADLKAATTTTRAIAPPPLEHEKYKAPPAASTPTRSLPHSSNPASPDAPASAGGGGPKTKKVIRKVRKVRRKRESAEETGAPKATTTVSQSHPPVVLSTFPTPAPMPKQAEPCPEQAPVPQVRRYNHKDYYYNAPAENTYAGMSKSYAEQQQQSQQPQPPAQPVPSRSYVTSTPAPAPAPTPRYTPPAPAPAPAAAPRHTPPMPAPAPVLTGGRPSTIVVPVTPSHDPSSYHDEDEVEEVYEEEEEEIIEEYDEEDEEEYEEIIEEEEVVYDDEEEDEEEYGHEEADISDLQAILAAKQAELARLQAQLAHG